MRLQDFLAEPDAEVVEVTISGLTARLRRLELSDLAIVETIGGGTRRQTATRVLLAMVDEADEDVYPRDDLVELRRTGRTLLRRVLLADVEAFDQAIPK